MEPTGERIREAAVELFAERGFHGTGIRDLAVRAGLSSATLYHYMGTKEDLLVSIMEQSLQRLLATARPVAGEGPPLDRVVGLVQVHVLTHATWRRETRVVDDEMRALSPARRTGIVGLRDEYEGLWQHAIEAGRQAEVFRVDDARVARLALLEMCSGVARWYQPGGPIGLDELATRYAAMALGLLGAQSVARSGPPLIEQSRRLVAEHWPAPAPLEA